MLTPPRSVSLKARGPVEVWLGAVETAMKFSLQKIMKQSILDFAGRPHERDQWALDYPAQIVIAVSQINWCKDITRCLTEGGSSTGGCIGALEKYKTRQVRQ